MVYCAVLYDILDGNSSNTPSTASIQRLQSKLSIFAKGSLVKVSMHNLCNAI